MVPRRVRLLEVEAPHEPEGRAACPHPAAEQAGHSGRSRRGEDTQPYLPLAVQGFKARKMFSENSHLDPLPFSQRGEGKHDAVAANVVALLRGHIPSVVCSVESGCATHSFTDL